MNLARDGAVLLRGFEGDVERMFGGRVEELSGPVDYDAGAWELEPGDIVVSGRDAARYRRGTRERIWSALEPGALHVAAVPGSFPLPPYLEYLFGESGVVGFHAFDADVAAAARLVGKPIGEVTDRPVDYVYGSHRWLSVHRHPSDAEIGEMYETMQVRQWEYGPGDVQVAHGNLLRVRRGDYVGQYIESPVLGGDLGEDAVHVSYRRLES